MSRRKIAKHSPNCWLHFRMLSAVICEVCTNRFPKSRLVFPKSPPLSIALQIFKYLDQWNRNNDLATSIRILERQANGLMDVCGACERIRNTPMVPSYRCMAWSSVILYCLVSPWGLGMNLGWAGIPIVLLATGFLLGMELVAEAIAEPFGTEPDDLPLERYCGSIESFVRETLGEPNR